METDGERLYVPLSEGDVVAMDLNSLSETLWSFDTAKGVWAQPLVVEGTLYVPSMDHHLYAVDAETGAELWRQNLGGAVTSTPVFHEGSLYVGSFARKLYQIDAATGSITAEAQTNDWIWGSPVIVDGTVYVADAGGWVYALNAGDLSEIWGKKIANRTIRATPVVYGDFVIVASRDQNLYWLNRATGDEIAANRQAVGGEILADMLVIEPSESVNIAEPQVIVTTMAHDNNVVAYWIESATEAWRGPR
jgi:outer membrane protein assembly factor BamB